VLPVLIHPGTNPTTRALAVLFATDQSTVDIPVHDQQELPPQLQHANHHLRAPASGGCR
jgi:hypothetical protein